MFKESNLVKIVTSLPHFSKSHPKNKIILIYDDEHEQILYADHFEKKQGIVPDLRLSYTGTDYKTSIKNDLNFADVNVVHYWLYNEPRFSIEFDNFYQYDNFTYYYPLNKMIEMLNKDKIKSFQIKERAPYALSKDFDAFHKEFCNAFAKLEQNGIGVNTNIISTFGHQVAKYIHDKKLYQNYNFFTTTSRPSNSIHNLNFAALTEEHRRCFSPLNDVFIEFDFDAYHPRLIGDLVGYEFPKTSVHEYLSKKYNVDVKEGKTRTFQYMYGGIPNDVARKVEFLNLTKKLIQEMWNEYKENKFIKTHTYKRMLYEKNLDNMNPQKLFNYYIQAYETERNVKLLNKLHQYLLTRETNIVHYNYDSFLFDYSKTDGVETIHEIKKILEHNGFITKTKVGNNYGDMKAYEF